MEPGSVALLSLRPAPARNGGHGGPGRLILPWRKDHQAQAFQAPGHGRTSGKGGGRAGAEAEAEAEERKQPYQVGLVCVFRRKKNTSTFKGVTNGSPYTTGSPLDTLGGSRYIIVVLMGSFFNIYKLPCSRSHRRFVVQEPDGLKRKC